MAVNTPFVQRQETNARLVARQARAAFLIMRWRAPRDWWRARPRRHDRRRDAARTVALRRGAAYAWRVPPDLAPAAVHVNPRALRAFGAAHVILHGRACRYRVRDFEGPASLKAVVRGDALWTTPDGHFRVDASAWLFVNRGQPYSLIIDSAREVETFCVFFRDGFLEQARASVALSPSRLLDDPEWVGPPLELAETLRPHGGPVTAALRAALRAVDGAGGGLALEERILEASLALAATGEELRRSADRLGAARPATRF
jgi:hypothetical protein